MLVMIKIFKNSKEKITVAKLITLPLQNKVTHKAKTILN